MNEWEPIKGQSHSQKEGRVGRRSLFCNGMHGMLISVTAPCEIDVYRGVLSGMKGGQHFLLLVFLCGEV